MRLFLIAIATLSLGAGATFAQVPATTPPILSPLRLHDSGVGDCMEIVGFRNPYDEAGMVASMQARPDTS